MYSFFNGRLFVEGAAANSWFTTRPAVGSTFVGTAKNDQIPDTVGGATLAGGLGDDVYLILDGRSKIIEREGEGIDSVIAYTHFRLTSHIEKLTIPGNLVTGIASDTGSLIISTGERNNLVSGRGDDILSDESSGKQNIFVFHEGSGKDVIYHFQATGPEHDLLRIDRAGFTSFDDVRAAMRQVGSDVLLSFSADDAVLLKGVVLADLTSDDFLLRFSPDALTLTFADEFDTLSLYDETTGAGIWKTTFEHGPANGWGSLWARTLPDNHELQLYLDPGYAGNPEASTTKLGINPFSTANGVLSIHADRLTAEQSDKLWGYDYYSGLLTTAKSFVQTYGYFEIRAELPLEKGMFPAFWLLPQAPTWPPEIDIFENIGQDYVSGGAITSTDRDAFYTYFPDGLTGMHTYGLLWDESTITWYVDGMAVGAIDTPDSMHQDMYLLFNLAVGGDWAGSPDARFDGADLKVDYVRVYSLEEAPPRAITADVTTTLADGVSDLTLIGDQAIDGTGNALANTLSGNTARNVLRGLDGSDHLLGNAGADRLYGGDGDDTLAGGAAADIMWGGSGNDIYLVDLVKDRVNENAGEGTDWIHSSVNRTIDANVEHLLLLDGATKGFGNELANQMIGNAAANRLYGHDGDDRLEGAGGDDILDGGDGANTLVGGVGNDAYLVRSRADIIIEAAGEGRDEVRAFVSDLMLADQVEVLKLMGDVANGSGNSLDNDISGNAAANRLFGGAGNDNIFGRAGNDFIDGGTGNDRLTGGGGGDIFAFDQQFGADIVTDFGRGDTLDFSYWRGAGIPVTVAASGDDTVITMMGNAVTLLGVAPDHLQATANGFAFI